MKKICFFIDNISHIGGTERVCSLIANALAERRCDYQVFILNKSKPEKVFYSIAAQIQIEYLSELNQNHYFTMIIKLRRFLKEKQINIIVDVDTSFAPITELARFLLPVKHIAWEHFNAKSGKCSLKQRIGRNIALHCADALVLLTESDRKNYPKRNEKIYVISNPLSFYPEKQAKLDKCQFISVGRLTEQKGFDRLIDAFAMLAPKYPQWVLRIAGDGELKEELQKQIERKNMQDKVKLIGVQQDVVSVLLESSIFVLSSRYEGSPMILLEAMSCGVPPVSFDCPYGPGDVIKEGCGILAEPDNIAELAGSMELLIANKDLRISMGQKAREEVRQYKIESIINKWIGLL